MSCCLLENFGFFFFWKFCFFLAKFTFYGRFYSKWMTFSLLVLCIGHCFDDNFLLLLFVRHSPSIEILITNNFVSLIQQKQRKSPIKQTIQLSNRVWAPTSLYTKQYIYLYTFTHTLNTIFIFLHFINIYHHHLNHKIYICFSLDSYRLLYCKKKKTKKILNDGQKECAMSV